MAKKSTAAHAQAAALCAAALRGAYVYEAEALAGLVGGPAAAAAVAAIGALPWGACGCYFVTRRGGRATLHRNGQEVGGEGAYGLFRAPAPRAPRPGRGAHLETQARARALREGLRALPAATRSALVAAYLDEGILPLGGGWVYRGGQEGGVIRRPALGPWAQDELPWAWVRPAGRAILEVFGAEIRAEEARRDAEAEAARDAQRAVEARAWAEAQVRASEARVRALRASFGDRCAL